MFLLLSLFGAGLYGETKRREPQPPSSTTAESNNGSIEEATNINVTLSVPIDVSADPSTMPSTVCKA